jgi:hypothetical protein
MKLSAILFAFGLSVAAIVLKLLNLQLPENFGIFYALALFCGCFLRGALGWALPVAALLFSDIAGQLIDDSMLGVYSVNAMLLNYAGLAAMTGFGTALRKNQNLFLVAGCSLAGASVFFVLSNFGAFLDPLMGYDRSLAGLMDCFAKGLPFARGTFSSSLIFSLASFATYNWWMASVVQPSHATVTERNIAN